MPRSGWNGILQDGSAECGQLTEKTDDEVSSQCVVRGLDVCGLGLCVHYFHVGQNACYPVILFILDLVWAVYFKMLEMLAAVRASYNILLCYATLFRAMAPLRLHWRH